MTLLPQNFNGPFQLSGWNKKVVRFARANEFDADTCYCQRMRYCCYRSNDGV